MFLMMFSLTLKHPVEFTQLGQALAAAVARKSLQHLLCRAFNIQ
jgi:hypothetical protein